jgi:hypothetical protein
VSERLPTAVAVAVAALALTGCAVAGGGGARTTVTASASSSLASATTASATAPATDGARSRAIAKVAAADRTHEVPTPAPAERVAGGWRTPEEAVDAFATRYINWNARDVSTQLRTLARVSVGQARSAMTQAASGTASDYELKQGGIANSGQVEAIAPVAAARDQYAVVTRERTTATNSDEYQGLAPQWHLALATVTRTSGGLWVLSDWQPES